MTRGIRIALTTSLLVMATTMLGAQGVDGVPDAVTHSTRPTYFGKFPGSRFAATCARAHLPDSLSLTFSSTPTTVRTWIAQQYRSVWSTLRVAEAVTGTYRVVAFSCDAGGPRVLLERSGYHLELGPSAFATVSASGEVLSGVVYDRITGRRLLLDTTTDSVTLVDADQRAAEVRRANALAAEAARQERERAEAERLAREREALEREIARFRRLGATRDEALAAAEGRVVAGMPTAVVEAVLGPPASRTTEVTRLGSRTVWRYARGTLVFESGRLVEIR